MFAVVLKACEWQYAQMSESTLLLVVVIRIKSNQAMSFFLPLCYNSRFYTVFSYVGYTFASSGGK